MSKTTWNPWGIGYNELFERWLRAGVLSGIITDLHFDYEDLIPLVDNAERLDLLGDTSRDQAILLVGLWIGRYQGNQDTGLWKNKPLESGSDIEIAQKACQEFIEAAGGEEGRPFWEAFARLTVALGNLHPENS